MFDIIFLKIYHSLLAFWRTLNASVKYLGSLHDSALLNSKNGSFEAVLLTYRKGLSPED